MAIVIDKISFTNYRQYGTGSISFNTKENGLLSVLIAKNGTGKTTLLNAITWCLYGQEMHLADEKKALPMLNSAVAKAADLKDYIPVAVAITIIVDDDTVIEFQRKATFRFANGANNSKRIIAGHDHLEVSTTKIGQFSNTDVKTGPDADIIVKQYFDKAIFKYYFFDGEKLADFFSANQAESIQQSIFNISQITLLENALYRLNKMHAEKTKKVAKGSPDLEKMNTEYDSHQEKRDTAQALFDKNSQDAEMLRREIDAIDSLLRGYEPVKKLQQERDALSKKLKSVEDSEASLHTRKTAFIRKYTVLLTLYPRIKKTLDIIREKEAKGDLPPAIDRDLIKRLLDHHEATCPICASTLDDNAYDHLTKVLADYSVSSHTSNYLKEIKGALENYLDEAQNFKKKLDEIRQTEVDLAAQRNEITTRLQEIASMLSNFESTGGSVNVSKTEAQRAEKIQQLNYANQVIGATKQQIQFHEDQMKQIEGQRNSILKKMHEFEELRKQIQVLELLYNYFKTFKTEIMDEMKEEIRTITWDFFDNMIWKRNTFGRISISDSYNVAVYNKAGTEMTGSLSATEQMALAYAFTLAIHKASGRNCPLVIDSPLGRVSDENRENMAAALKEVSKDKQIIMLFTPDEYSEQVRGIYDGVADVRELALSSDENYVEGIEH